MNDYDDELNDLCEAWLLAKEKERSIIQSRREVEDEIKRLTGISDDFEGTQNLENEQFRLKMIGRVNRTINSDLLQDLAIEAGLTEQLSTLFRWKPEINSREWEVCDQSIITALSGAITSKPGRLSFAITKQETN